MQKAVCSELKTVPTDSDHAQRKRYDPGEHRSKHCWSEPRADFVRCGSAEIGKCPSTLSKQQAERLLNEGIGYPVGEAIPQRIYNVHGGIVYEAVCSGDSWHGYPWRYRPGRKALPRDMLRELEDRASQQNCLDAYKDWMKRYGK